ncbi:FxSxx-COOH system tetratricopeptide repeat protein [Nocardiopsis sp. MG754419]|uniref:FxSxx-COOH system tetratricopeptide repeat protein n=1 Tax=Nocardiopsis sp. MG754419 TaxID=2259865 RepID=UPI001BA622B6|nr:FxSxx-COOH system tetratricopeptide repeat protein [Nocardiopsis sp. MG754419]MBR8744507.1 tetratricopeptide repeat protein [Nocardiopsis sp. MG754419]
MTTGRLRRRDPARLPVIGGVPRTHPHFTGRESALEQIHEVLTRPGSRFLIGGGSGVGKSRLAAEYAHRHAEHYDLIWWIPASSDIDAHRAYLRLAEHIGVPVAYEHVPRAVQTVRDALAEDPSFGRWLLVFDDVTDVERLAADYFPPGDRGNILVTSRELRRTARSLPGGRFDGQVIPRFTKSESLALLRRVCPDRLADPREGERLAELLEHLPLALIQVGAFLSESTVSTQVFLETFEERYHQTLGHAGPDDPTVPLRVAWDMQAEELAAGEREAHETEHMVLELIRLCAFLAPRPLGRTLFSRSGGLGPTPAGTALLGDDVRLGRVLDHMKRHHLAHFDHGRDTFRLHELFQSVIRDSLPHAERVRYRDLAHLILSRSDPGAPADPAHRTTYLRLYAHVKAAQAWLGRDPRVRDLVLNVADLLIEVGNYSDATSLVDQAANAWSDDPVRRTDARLRRNKIRRIHGEYATALAEAERIHADQVERAGGAIDEALDPLRAVAISLSGLARFDEAERIFRRILDHRRARHTDADPRTLGAAHDYGQTLLEQGRFEAALDIDQSTLRGRLLVLGPDDVHTLRSGLSVGLDLILLGRLEEARTQIEECMERFATTVEADSPHAIQGRMLLSVIHRRLGAGDRALAESRRSLALYRRKHPPNARLSLYLRVIHMVTLAGTGAREDLREALDEAERILPPLDERYPQAHPFPATARLGAAIALRAAGRYDEALALDQEGLERLTRIYGPGAFSRLPAAVNTATDLYHLDRVEEAARLEAAAEADCRRRLPADHPILLTVRRNHLVSRQALGEDVSPGWDALRAEFLARFGADHPGTVSLSSFTRQDCDVFPIAPL